MKVLRSFVKVPLLRNVTDQLTFLYSNTACHSSINASGRRQDLPYLNTQCCGVMLKSYNWPPKCVSTCKIINRPMYFHVIYLEMENAKIPIGRTSERITLPDSSLISNQSYHKSIIERDHGRLSSPSERSSISTTRFSPTLKANASHTYKLIVTAVENF